MAYTVEKIRKIITSGNTTMDNFLKSLTEQDRQDLLDLYKQEATYYYTQVAPQVISKFICNDCLVRINRLTINDIFHKVITYGDVKQHSYANSRYDSLIHEILMFNRKNTDFIDNRLAQELG